MPHAAVRRLLHQHAPRRATSTEYPRRHTLAVPWQPGDLMLVDNMLTLHGREAYEGERLVPVGMI